MSPGDRCDAVIRLIDEALSDDAAEVNAEAPESDGDDAVEIPAEKWGVYYLKPTA